MRGSQSGMPISRLRVVQVAPVGIFKDQDSAQGAARATSRAMPCLPTDAHKDSTQ